MALCPCGDPPASASGGFVVPLAGPCPGFKLGCIANLLGTSTLPVMSLLCPLAFDVTVVSGELQVEVLPAGDVEGLSFPAAGMAVLATASAAQQRFAGHYTVSSEPDSGEWIIPCDSEDAPPYSESARGSYGLHWRLEAVAVAARVHDKDEDHWHTNGALFKLVCLSACQCVCIESGVPVVVVLALRVVDYD